MTEEGRLRRLHRLDELARLLDEDDELVYVRYSEGPEADAEARSMDQESGLELPGLSVNPLRPEPWWTRPVQDWLARQLCQYAHLLRTDGRRRAWVLTGRRAGSGPDCEPLIADPVPLALLDDALIEEADRVYTERFDRR